MTDDPQRTCSGAQLAGAFALAGRYFKHADPVERDRAFETVAEFHELAGLTDGWLDTALDIGERMSAEILSHMGMPADPRFAAMVSVPALKAMLAAAYVRGMAIGSMAALDVTDPDMDGGVG